MFPSIEVALIGYGDAAEIAMNPPTPTPYADKSFVICASPFAKVTLSVVFNNLIPPNFVFKSNESYEFQNILGLIYFYFLERCFENENKVSGKKDSP